MGWGEVRRLFDLLPALTTADARLSIYGPFKEGGTFTTPSNAAFDAALRTADPRRGLRDIEAVEALAQAAGFARIDDRAMPANNRCVTWRRLA